MELRLKHEPTDKDLRIAELEAEVRRLQAQLGAPSRGAAAADPDADTFREVANSIDQMIWTARPDGFHDYFNRRWYEYTGVPEGSTDGEEWNGMFHPDDQERAWDTWRHSLASGEAYQISYRLRHASGDYRWVLGRARPLRGADGTILRWYGTCTDIDDLKVAEHKQRDSEERLQRALDAGEIGDYDWDLQSGEIKWSHNLMKIVGLPAETQVTGDTVWNLIHPDDRQHAQAAVEKAIATGEQLDVVYRVTGLDGAGRWIASRGRVLRDGAGNPIRLVGVNFDVTAVHEAEERLRETEARLQTLTDNLPGVVVYQLVTSRDMSERSYLHVSASSEQVLGVSPEAALRDPAVLMSRIDPAQVEEVLKAEREAAARLDTIDDEITIRTDHREVRVRIISRPRELPDGRLLWDGMAIDISERRRAQEEAERTFALLRAIGDATPDLIYAKGLDLRLLHANAATCRTMGIAPEQAIGISNQEIASNAEEAAALDANDRRVIESGETQIVEEVFTSRDGTRRVFRAAKTPMRDAAGEIIGLAGVGTDITDRVEAEELLRQSEARFRFLDDLSTATRGQTDAGAIMAATTQLLGQYMEVDICAYADVEPDEDLFTIRSDWTAGGIPSIAGTYRLDSFGEVAAAAQRGGTPLVLRDTIAELGEEQAATFLSIGIRATVCLPLVKNGRLAAMMAVHSAKPRDWTAAEVALVGEVTERCWAHVERVGAEAVLREAEGRLRELADHIDQFAWTADHTGWINWYNRRWYEYTGTTLEQMQGWGWQEVHHPEHVDRVVRSFSDAIARGKAWEDSFPLRCHDGSYRWFLSRAQPIRDSSGEVVRWFGTNTDVTELRGIEQELLRLNETLEQRVAEEVQRRTETEEALRQAQKMETLGQLTGGVAHDFNNLLQIVSGNLDLLQRGLPKDAPRLRRAAENAARGAERAAVLTQRLLAFARRQPLAPKPLDLNKLVSGMSDLLHRTLGETIEVGTELAPDLWPVEADPHQLENAIINLVVNGRDAMPEGGMVTIGTSNTHLDRENSGHRGDVVPGPYVAICVRDTGTGMDEDTAARAFEPFFTTKDVGKGTGLGLSMVYGFVKQSGGHLRIDSELGRGTEVRIYLPRLHGPEPLADKEAEGAVPEGAQDETILVCEDDDDVRAYTVEVLRELGYRVLEAHDGPSAMRLLERQEDEIDLLFTDVVLPSGMTGADLARAAREVQPGLKVLFTTGYARSAIVHHGRLDPGVELIAKPFSYSDLAAKVREMMDGGT